MCLPPPWPQGAAARSSCRLLGASVFKCKGPVTALAVRPSRNDSRTGGGDSGATMSKGGGRYDIVHQFRIPQDALYKFYNFEFLIVNCHHTPHPETYLITS
jgi:hypothetical protein